MRSTVFKSGSSASRWLSATRSIAMLVTASLAVSMSDLPIFRAEPAAAVQATQDAPLVRPDEASALITARMTGKRVEITGLTTEYDQAFATPSGVVEWEHRYRAVRVARAGGWVPADTTLELRPDGTVGPKAAIVDMAFSGGGTGALVAVDDAGRKLSLGAPVASLPKPELSGDTAVYPEVLPGVDLQVKADVEGYSQVLVVKTPQAAANPKLAKLDFPVTTKGLKVEKDTGGNLRVVDSKGKEVFHGSAPQMWNDPAQRQEMMPAAAGEDLSDGSASRVAGQLPERKNMNTTISSGKLSVVPDAEMLGGQSASFPLYIDPSFSVSRGNWGYVDSFYPTTAYWNTSEDATAGSWNAGGNIRRTFFNLPINGGFAGKYVTSANLKLNNTWSYSCTVTQTELWATGYASSTLTWNNQPAWSGVQQARAFAHGYDTSCPDAYESFDVTNNARAAAAGSWANMTLALKVSSESSSLSWKRFDNNPLLTVNYTSHPTVGTRSTTPSTSCVIGSARPFVNTARPQLKAAVSDPEGSTVKAEFEWWAVGGAAKIGSAVTGTAASGSTLSTTVPAGAFSNGSNYQWRVRGNDGTVDGAWSSWCEFTVDTTTPGTAPTVSSSTYPAGAWAGKAGTAGSFTLGAAGISDVSAYVYGLDTNPPTTVITAPSLGANASVSITPASDGPHSLFVQSRDRAGNLSPVKEYKFNVGAGAVTSPKSGDMSAGWVALEGIGQSAATGVTYQWRRGDADAWSTIPAGDVTVAAGGGSVTWPLATTGGGGFAKLNWDMAKTVNDAEAGPNPLDGPLQLQAVFVGGTGGTSSTIKYSFDRNRAAAATAAVGPGSVNLITGNLIVSDSDASVAGLGVSRSFNTREPAGVDPLFGPGWNAGALAADAQAPYTGLTVTGSLVQVGLPDADTIGFAKKQNTAIGADFDAELGGEALILKYVTTGDKYTLTDAEGTVTAFTRPAGTPTGEYVPTAVSLPGSQTTSLSWEKATVDGVDVMRPTRVLAPVPTGVTCTTLVRGCRALNFTYAAASTASGTSEQSWGDWTGRIKEIGFTAWDPAASAMKTVVLARYAYDNTGRLRAAWDPRLDHDGGQHLADRYSYDGDGVLTEIRPNTEEPWQLSYTTIPGDPGKGRLHQLTRSALSAGTAKTTVVYHVPTTGAGAPYDLSAGQTARWSQVEAPVEATAVFGPNQVPDGDQAAGAMPSSFERAMLTYVDANSRAVDTVVPGGGTTATWYDQYGNVVRELTAGNRQRALDASGTDNSADEAVLARAYSTANVYSADGQNLAYTLEPEHDVQLVAGSVVRGRRYTGYTYDEGAPGTGGPFNLATTTVTQVRWLASGGVQQDADARVTKTEYDWTLQAPVKEIADPTGLALTSRTTYDTKGRILTQTTPAGGASDTTPSTRVTVYYTAVANSTYPQCGGRPEWDGLVCLGKTGGQPGSGAQLPTTTVEYDIYAQVTRSTESTSAGTLRTTTTGYDAAGRVETVAITAAGLGQALETRKNVYDIASGQLARTQTVNGSTVTAEVTRGYDTLGRPTGYTDADGNSATTSYDLLDRAITVTDGKATRTYTYDEGSERRGLATSVTDSEAGRFTATYDTDGNPISQTWPNGVNVAVIANEEGEATSLTYSQPGCGQPDCTLYSEQAEAGAHGQRLNRTSTLSSQNYTYDAAGRLTKAADTVTGQCTTRIHGFDTATNRTALTAYAPDATGGCQAATPASSATWTYDSADRATASGYSYDNLGRTLTMPGVDTAVPGDGQATLTYHVNNMARSIAQAGKTTTYNLDVISNRFHSWADGTVTKVNHYADDSDKPAWTDEGNGQHTRLITGLGGVAAEHTVANGVVWVLANLNGDFVASMAQTGFGLIATSEYTENGLPRNGADVGKRYGWMGAAQRAADTPGGLTLMGARVYAPGSGRFLSTDPVYGGNANAYEYCSGDSVGCADTTGMRSCKYEKRFLKMHWRGLRYDFYFRCSMNHWQVKAAIATGSVFSALNLAIGGIVAATGIGIGIGIIQMTIGALQAGLMWFLNELYSDFCKPRGVYFNVGIKYGISTNWKKKTYGVDKGCVSWKNDI